MTPNRGTDADQPHPAIIQVQTEQQLLHQRLESSLSAFAGQMSAMQGDLQGVKAKLDTLAHAQADFTHHSGAVDRVNKALEKFIETTDRRMAGYETVNRTLSETVSGHKGGIRTAAFFVGLLVVAVGTINGMQISAANQRMADHLAAGVETKAAIQQRFQRNENDIHDLQAQMRAVRAP